MIFFLFFYRVEKAGFFALAPLRCGPGRGRAAGGGGPALKIRGRKGGCNRT